MPITGTGNTTAGSRLGVLYGASRIIDSEAFYVRIIA